PMCEANRGRVPEVRPPESQQAPCGGARRNSSIVKRLEFPSTHLSLDATVWTTGSTRRATLDGSPRGRVDNAASELSGTTYGRGRRTPWRSGRCIRKRDRDSTGRCSK